MPSIVNIESFISIITVFVLVGCLCIYIHKRAGSSFSLINKVVNFLYSGKPFHSRRIERIWREREDVERFNTIFSTRAENVKQIDEFYTWVNKFQLNFKMLTNLGGNLDMKNRKITKVSWWVILPTGLLTPVMAVFSLFILAVSFNNSALIRLNDHKDAGWFWINDHVAYSFQTLFEATAKWKIYKKSCGKGEANKEVSGAFTKVLCESFNSEESVLYINDLIESQKTLKYHSFFIMLFTMYMYAFVSESLRAKKARKMVYIRMLSYMKANKNI